MGYPYRVAAQISMYPMDYPHAALLLPHQIRVWAPMVDRIVVTIDTHRSRTGRYRGNHFEEYRDKLLALARELQRDTPQLEVIEVDYSDRARHDVAQSFFGLDDIPVKAWDGGPFTPTFMACTTARPATSCTSMATCCLAAAATAGWKKPSPSPKMIRPSC